MQRPGRFGRPTGTSQRTRRCPRARGIAPVAPLCANTGVNGRGLPLDGGASCIHDLPPLYGGAAVSTAPPDYFIVLQQARHGNGWRVSP